MKENMILNDFSTINRTTTSRVSELEAMRVQKEQEIVKLYKQSRDLRTT